MKVAGIGVLILVCAFFGSQLFDARIESKQKADLIEETKELASFVDWQNVANLHADETDLTNPEYIHLKKVFVNFHNADIDSRFAYLLGFHEDIGKQFFYVDSEDPHSKDYSAPGDIYEETTAQDVVGYKAGSSYVEGPYRDSWGEWVSGNAPVKNNAGAVVAQVGIDISTAQWHKQILVSNLFIAIITFLCLCITLILAKVFYKKEQKVVELTKEKEVLLHDVSALKSVQILAYVGRISIHFPEKFISLDEQFAPLYKEQKTDALSFNDVRAYIHPDDIEHFEKMLGEIEGGSVSYTWCDIRFGNLENGFREYHIYGNVKKEENNVVFSGIMQDISDIKS